MQATATTKTRIEILSIPELNGERGAVGIGGHLYMVWDAGWKHTYQKFESSEVHTVSLRGGKPLGCTCKDFRFRKGPQGQGCKHMDASQEILSQW